MGQKDDSQLDALRSAGCERIWTDRASGKLARRPEWDDLLGYLRSGDELVITRLSRMARSYGISPRSLPDLHERDINLIVLKQGIDTTTPAGRFLFHVIGAMDEMLADLISEGTGGAAGRPRPRKDWWSQAETLCAAGHHREADVRGEGAGRQTPLHRRRRRRNVPCVPQDHLPTPRIDRHCRFPRNEIGPGRYATCAKPRLRPMSRWISP